MKRGVLIFIILLIISFNYVSACSTSKNQVGIVLKKGDKADLNLLERYCNNETCIVKDNEIIYTTSFNSNLSIIVKDRLNKVVEGKTKKNMLYSSEIIIELRGTDYDNLFKSSSGQVSLEELYNFDWNSATKKVLKSLLEKEIIERINEAEIEEIAALMNPGSLVYFKPGECDDSYYEDSLKTDKGNFGWLNTTGDCLIQEYMGECPQIQCFACSSSPSTFNLIALPLTLEKLDKIEKPSTPFYFIFIGLTVLIIFTIVIFFLFLKRRENVIKFILGIN